MLALYGSTMHVAMHVAIHFKPYLARPGKAMNVTLPYEDIWISFFLLLEKYNY